MYKEWTGRVLSSCQAGLLLGGKLACSPQLPGCWHRFCLCVAPAPCPGLWARRTDGLCPRGFLDPVESLVKMKVGQQALFSLSTTF